MHAPRRAGDQTAHDGRGRWRLLLCRPRGRQVEAEAIDQPAHARLPELRSAPLEWIVERAGEGDDGTAAPGLAAALVASVEPMRRGRAVEIERIGAVAVCVGDADGSQDL